MSERARNDVSDRLVGSAPNVAPGNRSGRALFFKIKAHTKTERWVIVIYCWGKQYPVGQTGKEAQTSQPSELPVAKGGMLNKIV